MSQNTPIRRLIVQVFDPTGGKPVQDIHAGARRFGPTTTDLPDRFTPNDVLITWSPFRASRRAAVVAAAKAAGSRVVVMERGWLSPIQGAPYFQVALDGWNGTGRFEPGGAERWRSWGVTLRDWRRDGEHVLVIGNNRRHTTRDPRRTPKGWAESVLFDSPRPVVRRLTRNKRISLQAQFENAWCTVVWTSTVAIKSILAGVPAFYCGPTLIGAELAKPGLDIENPVMPEREPVLERIAWSQWSKAEVAAGEPFARLFALPHSGEPETVEELPPIPSMWTLAGRFRAVGARVPRWSGLNGIVSRAFGIT